MQAAPFPPAPEITREEANDYLRQLSVSDAAVAVTPCVGGLSNHNYRVDFADGSRALLRVYRWSHDEPEPERSVKETWLHRLLYEIGVPVPHMIVASPRCALMEWVEGERLRQVALSEVPDALEPAWYQAGAALRTAHDAKGFGSHAGEIVADRVRPFALTWADWNAREMIAHAQQLRQLDAITASQFDHIERVCARLPALLGEPAVTLVHNDAHPANVLVAQKGGRWRLAAWIDWEYAWVADPDWDLARFAFFGEAQVGEVPDSFWTGYGRRAAPIRNSIYELHMITWLAGLRPTRRAPAAPELLAVGRLSHLDALLTTIDSF